ncbi:MAG: hypothetical protein ACLF0P_17555 [Thermoanaerobaculia bacterium]
MHLVILARGGGWERRYEASALAASAASRGDRVDLVLLFGALDAWVRGEWDALDPTPALDRDRLASLDFPSLSSLVESARAGGGEAGAGGGGLRLYGCSASARALGLDPGEVQGRVDVVCGWQTFTKLIAAADRVVTL